MERAPNNYSEWYTHLLVDLNSEILIQNQLYLSTVNYYIYRLYFPPLMCLRLHLKSPSQKYYLKNKTNKLCLPGRTLKKRNRGYPWGKEQHGWRTERKLATGYLCIPFECCTMWMHYIFFKTCLTKLLPSVGYFWLPSQKRILTLQNCGVHFNVTALWIWTSSSSAELFTPTAEQGNLASSSSSLNSSYMDHSTVSLH